VSITAARNSEYAVVAKRLRAESVNMSAAMTLRTADNEVKPAAVA